MARSLRPSHPLGTPRRHRRGLTASRTRAGGVLRGVRAEDPGALGACEPEKTPAPTPDPEGRVCNGGPYDGRRCQNHGFCQQPDPTQPDVDACDDCKCITRKDSDGAARTSSSGCFLVLSWGFELARSARCFMLFLLYNVYEAMFFLDLFWQMFF